MAIPIPKTTQKCDILKKYRMICHVCQIAIKRTPSCRLIYSSGVRFVARLCAGQIINLLILIIAFAYSLSAP